MRIERVVVTGDVFRTTNGDSNQIGNVHWLRDEIGPVLQALTGLEPEIGYRRNQVDSGSEILAGWYQQLGHAPSTEAWAATFGETAPPAALVEAMSPDYERALVIGFELSPLMGAILTRIGVPWINVELGPLRFLDDLALTVRFSWPIDGIAHPGLVAPHHVAEAVARVRARHRNDPSAAACIGACIFLAQTPTDRTLIKDGGFFPATEVVERVAKALDGRRLVLKPHPLAPGNPLLGVLQQHLGASITRANVYALLSAAKQVHFLTISSSAAIEARHFGHTPDMLHPAPHTGAVPMASLWAHRAAAFWRAALAPLLPLKSHAAVEEGPMHGRLRHRLGSWGYVHPTRPPERTTAVGVPADGAVADR